ncbi:vitelline membrane outer layer protein 1 homolog [Salminus brasiliensis]|uniref:vitelline membrane outer layer protein 1 homolog n=1 Tax=Salminus brasiliensis TaxID=930266 RepID=UPI003B82FC55
MHQHLFFVTVALFLASFGSQARGNRAERSIDRPFKSLLGVDNGQRWGEWGLKEMCPEGFYAAGFSLKVAGYWESLLVGDNTALNGIRLHCVNTAKGTTGPYTDYATVQSDTGSWGTWRDIQWCNSGTLKSFQLRVEPYQGTTWDDTAANNIRFKCSGDEELKGVGMSWGDWGSWSESCTGRGICGIQTIVEQPRGLGDDTALNDVRFFCCD